MQNWSFRTHFASQFVLILLSTISVLDGLIFLEVNLRRKKG